MKISIRMLALAGLVMAAACSDQPDATGPLSSPAFDRGREVGARRISIMTQNMYVGAETDAVVAALASGDPSVILPALQTALAELRRTDFPTRAAAIARIIEEERPDAVGLQEMYEIHVDLSGIGLPDRVDLDFLAILQAALARRHLPYVVAAQVTSTDATPFPGIELKDREVLLVNTSRVLVGPGVIAQTFENNIGVLAPGVDKKAAFIVAPATVDGTPVTFVTTHLESDLGPDSHPLVTQLRAAQAYEIIAAVGTASPVIMVGDLNDAAGSLMYQVLTGAGFVDAWPTLRPGEAGLTCCHVAALSDAVPPFDQRLDFILARGLGRRDASLVGTIELVGRRIRGPFGMIWPSDHAGVVGSFLAGGGNRER